jgi:glycosyltransferase involved in cell wall biosynthesis
MLIGINATAAFKQPRTGVEEYTYQLIKHLTMLEESRRHRFILYISEQRIADNEQYFSDFNLSNNFEIRKLRWSLPMWTQVRLAIEMLLHQPDVLFIPVHVLPLIHPQNSVVAIHGLEYEYYPKMYPWRHLRYLRWSTQYALKHARKIIAVSESTKKDLIELYGGEPEKIEVVYHGVKIPNSKIQIPNKSQISNPKLQTNQPYILFIGRLEAKKNIEGLIRAFDLLKRKYQVPHKLVLVGPKGYGYNQIFSFQFPIFKYKEDIIKMGYVDEKDKWRLYKNADLFVLPSFYEGFGLPILEAQAVGCPVVTSNVSSMPEVAGQGAVLVKPESIEEICQAMYKVISDDDFKKDLISKGYKNIERFSWQECAKKTLEILIE